MAERIERDGKVAVRRFHPRNVVITVNGTQYGFPIQHNVALCWMEPKDAAYAVAAKEFTEKPCSCPGAARRQMFSYATKEAVAVFEKGTY